MAKVRVATLDGDLGDGVTRALLARDDDPIHLHFHELAAGANLSIGPRPSDSVTYVWGGAVIAGGHTFAQGSSLVVEHGAKLILTAGEHGARLLVFTASIDDASGRAGNHVHAIPAAQVPLSAPNAHTGSIGGLHADSSCPTCTAWLHENSFPGMAAAPSPGEAARGIHCHSEDEVIVVIEGSIRLGRKLFGPGTAIAIAADTLYGFTPGPDGLRFINFRAQAPSAIRFPDGRTMDEIAYWKDLLGHPPAIELTV